MFNFIFNVLLSVVYGLWSIIMTLVTGKLCKISTYHSYHNSHDANPFEVCKDRYIKTQYPTNVSVTCKRQIISDFLKVAIDNHTDSKRMDVKLNEYLRDLKNNQFNEK